MNTSKKFKDDQEDDSQIKYFRLKEERKERLLDKKIELV